MIELLVASTIGVILVGFAVPMVQAALRSYTLSSATSNITRTMQLARNLAIRSGGNVCTALEGNMFGVDENCDGSLGTTEARYVLPYGVALDSTGPGNTDGMNFGIPPAAPADFVVTFSARGSITLAPQPQVVFIAGWDRFMAVTVSGAGRARGWQYEGSLWH